jgi:ssDNA thymidine ADP-ribosyltransferase, DarT
MRRAIYPRFTILSVVGILLESPRTLKVVRNRPIFHITHIDNLPHILTAGCIWSDRRLRSLQGNQTVIGFDHIKQRRLEELEVSCYPGTMVGEYVPFYFCPRSVMLYVIYKRKAELTYQGGQERVVHLVTMVNSAIKAAADRPWAFTDGNAGAYTIRGRFRADVNELETFVDWNAVRAKDWRDPTVKERKQAEFLVCDYFPWTSIESIGVISESVADEVKRILAIGGYRPTVAVQPGWYY